MRRKDREITDNHEFEEIINKADVCRIALANDNMPYIVSMNFGYINNPRKTLFFHCSNEGKKLEMIRKNNLVCFEMDIDHEIVKGKKGCDWGSKFTSIVGYGQIHIVTENNDKIEGLNSIMIHYGGEGEYNYDDNVVEKTTILRLEISEMTGKKKI
jgi:nitroimidazol reductase NimA-like FMN-containing flavoprotein (pyridoxamine 5'-phosphate oxidase superfamily)